jgi:hypothetical protein
MTTKLNKGDLVKFNDPITFLDGRELQILQWEGYSRFRDPDTGQGYHVVRWRWYAHEILPAADIVEDIAWSNSNPTGEVTL